MFLLHSPIIYGVFVSVYVYPMIQKRENIYFYVHEGQGSLMHIRKKFTQLI